MIIAAHPNLAAVLDAHGLTLDPGDRRSHQAGGSDAQIGDICSELWK
ncbi:MAG: hypothetical protein H6526_06590 [Actinobacteria bacterium]|nr:hypothetical protein [Actinomycetota bacterium]